MEDFRKVLDQTIRTIKREVNLKLLMVPEIEQKVLDATDDEPWGPHGAAMAEISEATEDNNECQMVMNMLWIRLNSTSSNWRHIYKALTIIEYLAANGSESAVNDIIEHSSEIAFTLGFKHVEPNGKDVGTNVRKKAETILGLLNDREKIRLIRDKASANRDKYVGFSSSEIRCKSNSSPFHGNHMLYGNRGWKSNVSSEDEYFRDSYENNDRSTEKFEKKNIRIIHDMPQMSHGHKKMEKHQYSGNAHFSVGDLRRTMSDNPTYQISSQVNDIGEDSDLDDFDPRGYSAIDNVDSQLPRDIDDFNPRASHNPTDLTCRSSSVLGSSVNSSHQEDLFSGNSVIHDPKPKDDTITAENIYDGETFPPHDTLTKAPNIQDNADDFTNEAFIPSLSEKPDPVDEAISIEAPKLDGKNIDSCEEVEASSKHLGIIDAKKENIEDNSNNKKDINPPIKDPFHVNSSVWADYLNRGLVDLNITSSKKTSLGILEGTGGKPDGKQNSNPSKAFMGRAMGPRSKSSIGSSEFPSLLGEGNNKTFSGLGEHKFGSFK